MKITKLSRRQTQIIVITAGLLLFLITIVYSVKTDINAQQVNRNLTHTKDEVTKDKLKTYAEEQRLTGMIIRKFIKIKDDKRNKRIYKKRIDNCILQL